MISLARSSSFLAVSAFASFLTVDAPAPCSCLIQPDKSVAVKPAPGRTVYCGLDVGSKTVKLSVVSMVKGQNATIKDERQCKRTLGMGALVFDSTAKTAKPLPAESIGYLSDTVKEYQRICTLDHGTMIAAGATQWARDATNTADVVKTVKADTGVTIDVLSPAQESDFSYVAAAVGASGRIVLDPGSNSFELAWQPKGSTTVSSILVAYGYVRGAVNDIEPAATYAAGRAAYQARVKAMIDEELGKLSPVMTLATLHDLVARGSIGPEIIALGQDGAVQLSARGLLKASPDSWIRDASSYDAVLTKQAFSADPSFGVLTAPPIRAAELSSFFSGIQSADFKALTSEPIRSLYGQKALVVPALVDLLFRELGATRLVMVPQENTTGHMLSKLGRSRP
jgi:hypothetical protein